MVEIIEGGKHVDNRGIVTYNNDFDTSAIKRIYTLENASIEFVRGWQGHKIEQRWFAAIVGSFEISVLELDDFENPSKDLILSKYTLTSEVLTYLHVPGGFITSIQSLETKSKLLVLADYQLWEIEDEYRFELDLFEQ